MRFFRHASFRKYFANTSWLAAERVFRLGVNFLVGIYVARYLGPQRFGELSYAMSFVGLFSVVALLGLDGIVVRELVKDEGRNDELLGTAFWLKLVGALLILVCLGVVVPVTSASPEEKILVFLIAAGLLFQSLNVIDFFFQSRVQSRYVVQAQLGQILLSSLIRIYLVWLEAALIWFAIAMIVDSAVLAFGLVINYWRNDRHIQRWRFRMDIARRLFRDSWPLILSGIVVSIYMKVDQVMIREMLGAEDVGNYAAAVRLSEVWYFIPMIISSSLFPAVLKAREVDQEKYFALLQGIYSLGTWLAISVMLPIALFAKEIVTLSYGIDYAESARLLAIYAWANLFVFFGVLKGNWVLAENQQIYNIIFQSIGMAINVVLNLVLIPIIGPEGAVYATLACVVSNTLISPLFINKKQRVQTLMFIKSINPAYMARVL
ncbi:MAG TPA: flippase [Sedimenticola sp.]|nr:flippase [Sedimenticola sp.]